MGAAWVGRAVVLVAFVLGVAPSVAVGAGWSVVPGPSPPGLSTGALSGVSCVSPQACTAVGASTAQVGPANEVTLAERWDGTSWRIEPTPNPAAARSELSSVSCGSATECVAVGSYTNSTGDQFVLAEQWNGTRWTIEPTPAPAQGQDELSSVSCVSATACTAVGYSGGSVLAEGWNGTRWTIEPTQGSGFGNAAFSGVSCTSPTACTAVGQSNGNPVAVAARWNGNAWAIQPTPGPAKTQASSFSSVSCSSASACTAVGYYNPQGGGDFSLAEGWNGKSWTVEPTPTTARGASPDLAGISCSTAIACTAVGPYTSGDATSHVTWAERWNGTRLDGPVHSEPAGRRWKRPCRRVVHGCRVHRGRPARLPGRPGYVVDERGAGGAVELNGLGDPADT